MAFIDLIKQSAEKKIIYSVHALDEMIAEDEMITKDEIRYIKTALRLNRMFFKNILPVTIS